MHAKMVVSLLTTLILGSVPLVQAQPTNVYRVGVIHEGGTFYAVIDGLRAGLSELGLEEGKNYTLEIHDLKGDRRAAVEAARRAVELAPDDPRTWQVLGIASYRAGHWDGALEALQKALQLALRYPPAETSTSWLHPTQAPIAKPSAYRLLGRTKALSHDLDPTP